MDEVENIKARYDRRGRDADTPAYGPLNPYIYMALQERERTLIRWIEWAKLAPLWNKRLIEIGCGTGVNLLQLIQLGFRPENLVGNELSSERAMVARGRLPAAIQILDGDALRLDLPPESFDVVLQATVFSSVLDHDFRRLLADCMWALAKPGGGILWYDFTYDNPRNADVRGIPLRSIQALFPDGRLKAWRITLAPPISRTVTSVHPSLYTLCNTLPFLRTHVLCWIAKR